MIWPMLPGDVDQVRHLAVLCGRPERPKNWFFANPTLVAMEGERRVIGFTSYTVTLIPGFGQTLYGQDVCVHPGHRGLGIARELHRARLQIARDIGATVFMGVTHPAQTAMVRILEESGMHRCLPSGDEFIYTGPIPEA
jgi:GNAT superfamily N-acetyltransferase